MQHSGTLQKMRVDLKEPVEYYMILDQEEVLLNPYIGQPLKLTWHEEIHCIGCGRKTKKSFSQGFCYPCFRSKAQCDMCIVKPEQCHYDEGTCREPEWGEANCLQPHYVYLANSSGVKVGITRHNQIPTRWIDQGAVQAIPILKVSSRLQSGLAEVAIKEHVADKTSWQKMLKGNAEPADLKQKQGEILSLAGQAIAELKEQFGDEAIEILDEEAISIEYPVETFPTKVKSFNFDKQSEIEGVLQGIKGQYLIFDTGVINIRKFGGYKVTIESL